MGPKLFLDPSQNLELDFARKSRSLDRILQPPGGCTPNATRSRLFPKHHTSRSLVAAARSRPYAARLEDQYHLALPERGCQVATRVPPLLYDRGLLTPARISRETEQHLKLQLA